MSSATAARAGRRQITAFIAAALLSLAAHSAVPAQSAGELWNTLPPTPALPAAAKAVTHP